MPVSNDYYKFIADDMKKDDSKRYSINADLADLYKGKLGEHISKRIAQEFSVKENIDELNLRALHINIVKRVTDKIAVAYKEAPMRELETESATDQEIFDYYSKIIDFNEAGTIVDRYVTMHKECLVWSYYNEMKMKPALKILRPWQYKVYSLDKQDDESTDLVVIPDKIGDEDVYKLYSDDSIVIIGPNGDVRRDIMRSMDNELGINPYGKMPFMYVRNERDKSMTYPDEAFLNIALFIPILFGDLNYAIKYQSFGMIWGRNVNADLIKRAPNGFLDLIPKNPDDTAPPEVGVIKPDIDINESLESAVKQLALWLNSRGLRPSAISASGESFSSAISKMVDEADVSQIVSQNQNLYKKYEKDLFDFMFKNGHPIWSKQNTTIPNLTFDYNNCVYTSFKEPKPFLTTNEIIDQQIKLLNAGLIGKEYALKSIFPEYKEDKIDEILGEMDEENGVEKEDPKKVEVKDAEDMTETKDSEGEYGRGLAED